MFYFKPRMQDDQPLAKIDWEAFGCKEIQCPFCGRKLSFPVLADTGWYVCCPCGATVRYVNKQLGKVVWLAALTEKEVNDSIKSRHLDN